MSIRKIAIPTNNPGGLEGKRSDHFGHCDVFTVVNLKDNKVDSVETIANEGHNAGGCMVPVKMLADKNVDALVVGGMGKRPLQGCQELGIQVYYADRKSYEDVDGVVKGMLLNSLQVMEPDQACKGHANCHSDK